MKDKQPDKTIKQSQEKKKKKLKSEIIIKPNLIILVDCFTGIELEGILNSVQKTNLSSSYILHNDHNKKPYSQYIFQTEIDLTDSEKTLILFNQIKNEVIEHLSKKSSKEQDALNLDLLKSLDDYSIQTSTIEYLDLNATKRKTQSNQFEVKIIVGNSVIFKFINQDLSFYYLKVNHGDVILFYEVCFYEISEIMYDIDKSSKGLQGSLILTYSP